MTADELKELSIPDLLELADKALSQYVTASIDPKTKRLADQRQEDLKLIQKIIAAKRSQDIPPNPA